ncbi:accessory gland protein Acp29AB-like [Drosophila takahashii]|uniref:accessory gland protein Acp29AB-like n=1 Tax=Drosophila takahashii TaxID=29030 RepID=UPI001CF882BB|nr:accessory gland protein Acp29AB-like [Drosophila takahashii]
MHNFAAFFLYAFVACNLYGLGKSQSQDDTGSVYILKDDPSRELQPLPNSIQFLQKQLKLQITTQKTTLAILDTMQKNTQEKLEAIQREVLKSLDQIRGETNERLIQIQNQQADIQMSIKALMERRQAETAPPKVVIIPPGFEKIGSRYFYIEEEVSKNWTDAQLFCREKGAYLAAIQDQKEFKDVTLKLQKDNRYWLGINDIENEGIYISDASGNVAPFLKWGLGDPDSMEKNEDCIGVVAGVAYSAMVDWPCKLEFHVICSLDNTV